MGGRIEKRFMARSSRSSRELESEPRGARARLEAGADRKVWFSSNPLSAERKPIRDRRGFEYRGASNR
jgi:hypothetical protein